MSNPTNHDQNRSFGEYYHPAQFSNQQPQQHVPTNNQQHGFAVGGVGPGGVGMVGGVALPHGIAAGVAAVGGIRQQAVLPTTNALGLSYLPNSINTTTTHNPDDVAMHHNHDSGEDEGTNPQQNALEQAHADKKKEAETEAAAKVKQDELDWYQYFAEFSIHKTELGTTHVSIGKDATDKARKLSKWVNSQRRQYRYFMQNKQLVEQQQQQLVQDSPDQPEGGGGGDGIGVTAAVATPPVTRHVELTEKQIALLEKIGFDFKYKEGTVVSVASPPAKKKSWDEWIELLKEYAKEHNGIADVPQKYPGGLGLFVARQRCRYRLWSEGNPKSKLSNDKVAQLQGAGMVFQSSRFHPQQMSWDDRLEELKTYKLEHGGTTWIPVNKTKKKPLAPGEEPTEQKLLEQALQPLAKWCDRQRQNYRALLAHKPSCMTDERIKKLNEIAFEWNRAEPPEGKKRAADSDPGDGTGPPKKKRARSLPAGFVSNAQKWLNQLELLKEYKKKHGHCRMKATKRKGADYDSLAKWCDHQRQQYKLKSDDKKSAMTDERIQHLEAMEFEWILTASKSGRFDYSEPPPPLANPRKPTEKAETQWNSHWKELKEFKNLHNTTRVTKKFKAKDGEEQYTTLAKWVEHQRTNMRLRYEGKQSPMTDERIAKLKEIEFEWAVVTKPIPSLKTKMEEDTSTSDNPIAAAAKDTTEIEGTKQSDEEKFHDAKQATEDESNTDAADKHTTEDAPTDTGTKDITDGTSALDAAVGKDTTDGESTPLEGTGEVVSL